MNRGNESRPTNLAALFLGVFTVPMLYSMLLRGYNLQVLQSIVPSIPILVVNELEAFQLSP